MPSKPTPLADLQSKCSLPPAKLRAALKAHDDDVEATLTSLIDSGDLQPNDLNPDTVSDELFERAAQKQKLDFYRQMTNPTEGGIFGNLLSNLTKSKETKDLAGVFQQLLSEQFGNKSPEELMAEDDAKQAAQFAKAQKSLPELRKIKRLTPGQSARISAQVNRRSRHLKSHPVTLKLPPFPPLRMTLSKWTGKDTLKSFAGTQQRHGGYTSLSSSKPSKGTFSLTIPRLGDDDTNPAPPSKEQVAAYAHLKEHQSEILDNVLAALLRDYSKLRKSWLKHNPDLKLPTITTPADMKKNIGLGNIHLHPIAKSGHAYIGLELGCTWDEEHGAGLLLHKSRVIATGQADTSFDQHAATKDGGKPIKPA